MDASDIPEKNNYLLLDFAYGTDQATHYRLTNYTSDVDSGGETFYSQPKLSVQLPENSGGTDPETCTVRLPKFDAWTTRVSDGLPHSGMTLRVQQVFLDTERQDTPATALQQFVYTGMLRKTFRNNNEQSTVVALEFQNVKGLFQVPLGIVIGAKCSFPFASEPCGVTIDPDLIQDREIDTIEGNVITFTSFLNNGGNPGWATWHKGYVEYEGLRLGIRFQTAGINRIQLYKRPPAYWLGKTVTVFPGCDKQLATCQFWNNEINNGTFGNKTPNYYPNVRNI